MNEAKLREVFSDKAYMESIVKLSAEEAAKSLQEKGVDVTAKDLMKVRDFLTAHKEELQNGELSEDALAGVAGGSGSSAVIISVWVGALILSIALPILW